MLKVRCPQCCSEQVVKFGIALKGKQRYCCQNKLCTKNTFLLEYKNRGRQLDIKQKIIEMALNGSGIRDTSRVLGISQNTVILELKKKKRKFKI